jgi:hypothetical protein
VRRKLDDGSGEDLGRQFERLDWMAAWLADVSLRDLSRGGILYCHRLDGEFHARRW